MLVNTPRKRFLFVIVAVLIIWQVMRFLPQFLFGPPEDLIIRHPGAPVMVMVYYEALCPDSKNFIVKQLQATYRRAPELMEVQFIPYGKASTHVQPDGSLRFECQHGPMECQANIYHACAIEAIEDARARIDVVACMIRDNQAAKEAMQKCTREYKVENSELIQKCYESPHGAELLKLHGDATNSLRPRMSFVPTITLDGSQGRQASILKDLFTEVCKVAAGRGPLPDVCKP
ncbi:unnamed protein product [Hermetia illucens]|uniref:Gamma-interferon-inducible lysosomal thiol reductase n=1 Tax=Hermetia illucens TaxID=343691 RepID=A0A7R8US22_HERIL|nr:gamma-interferon-inducible lysosomal thiol reductase isoform X2 [Hermetia illucens]CAD7085528.1 unnamed protein product [Hermetia illucens]